MRGCSCLWGILSGSVERGDFRRGLWEGTLRRRGKQREPRLSLSPRQDTARLEPGCPCSGPGLSWLGGQVQKASGPPSYLSESSWALRGQWQQPAGATPDLQGKWLTSDESAQARGVGEGEGKQHRAWHGNPHAARAGVRCPLGGGSTWVISPLSSPPDLTALTGRPPCLSCSVQGCAHPLGNLGLISLSCLPCIRLFGPQRRSAWAPAAEAEAPQRKASPPAQAPAHRHGAGPLCALREQGKRGPEPTLLLPRVPLPGPLGPAPHSCDLGQPCLLLGLRGSPSANRPRRSHIHAHAHTEACLDPPPPAPAPASSTQAQTQGSRDRCALLLSSHTHNVPKAKPDQPPVHVDTSQRTRHGVSNGAAQGLREQGFCYPDACSFRPPASGKEQTPPRPRPTRSPAELQGPRE